MLSLKPVTWRVVIDMWRISLTFGIFYAIYEWLLKWPASWIILLLFARSLIQALLYGRNLALEFHEGHLTGPTWFMISRRTLDATNGLVERKILGRVFVADHGGQEITFRRGWFDPAEYRRFERVVLAPRPTQIG